MLEKQQHGLGARSPERGQVHRTFKSQPFGELFDARLRRRGKKKAGWQSSSLQEPSIENRSALERHVPFVRNSIVSWAFHRGEKSRRTSCQARSQIKWRPKRAGFHGGYHNASERQPHILQPSGNRHYGGDSGSNLCPASTPFNICPNKITEAVLLNGCRVSLRAPGTPSMGGCSIHSKRHMPGRRK